MEKVMQKVEPKTGAMMVQIKARFNQCKLTDVQVDPKEWVTELEILRQKLVSMKVTMTKEYMMVHILNNLPKEYKSIIKISKNKVDEGEP